MGTFQLGNNKAKRSTRKPINYHQNKFPLGYVSTLDNSRRPQTSLSDMTNMEMVQDSVVRPRPPLVRYGTQPPYPVVGRGKYYYNGVKGLVWMLNVNGVGQVYYQTDGGTFTNVGGNYSVSQWTGFEQSKGKLYPYNSVDKLSYIDLKTWTIQTFTSIAAPGQPTGTPSANLSSSPAYTYFYAVTANNSVGESAGSVISAAVNVNTPRAVGTTTGSTGWSSNSSIAKTVALSWPAVTGATSYTVYLGSNALTLNELITVTGTTYTDDGSLSVNPYKLLPQADSSAGFIPSWLYNDPKNSQIFGVSASDNKLYYSAAGTNDFSAYDGGGWVTIDDTGTTMLNFVTGFRDGTGKPVITTSSRGSAGGGLLNHVTFEQLTIGDQIINYPNVYPASGQSGTYAPRATIKEQDGLFYPTGLDFKSTTTSQNILNILTTNTISLVINDVDVPKINLSALSNAVGVAYKQKLFFALPVSSSTNNEIWYMDLARKNAWILRWTVAANDLWLYEDSQGTTHFCALVNNKILEFTRAGAQPHQDDGIAFSSRVAFEDLVWDEDGIALGQVRQQFAKLLDPQGTINFNTTGLSRLGIQTSTGSDSFSVTTTYTGYDADGWLYDMHMYDDDPGTINTYGKSVAVLEVKPKGLLNQEAWELTANTAGTDYILSTVSTRGWYDENLILKA